MNSNFDTLYNEFNGSISSANLADGAVTEAKVANDSIGTLNVKDGAVTPTKISTGALLLGSGGGGSSEDNVEYKIGSLDWTVANGVTWDIKSNETG